jgi:hypothetical protein
MDDGSLPWTTSSGLDFYLVVVQDTKLGFLVWGTYVHEDFAHHVLGIYP